MLAEQFAARDDFTLRESDTPWPDAALIDDRGADARTKVEDMRRLGFPGAIILVVTDDAPCPGADATVKRPFRFAALLAAIDDAIARRAARGALPALAEGVRLTDKEAAILIRLQRAMGATVSKADLLAEIWGYGPNVSTRTLETHIHRLRRKIEADPARPSRLVTETDGYRLAAGDAPATLPAR